MTSTWSQMTSAQQGLAAAIFTALDDLDRLEAAPPAASPPGFAELYAFATDPQWGPSDQLTAALRADAALAADLERLLAKTSHARLPRLAAASSGLARKRDGARFSLEIKPSKAATAQVYLLIQLKDEGFRPKLLTVAAKGQEFARLSLPERQGMTLQLLLEADAPIVALLQNPESEVYLS